ncbi:unnamed protein product [Musa acuminata subsp. malaccensis]|uniref:(wild Malaysian banana) hypothetical protein n=1 Tax=Musa acuminata subsp. malaccensis TaxID=214687 RepID=A0A804HW59_MUSAM|nr:unnamed protein product [Musa acuminata subsp. malaccensis]
MVSCSIWEKANLKRHYFLFLFSRINPSHDFRRFCGL